jgi:parallel beta-helix repeat protein
MSFSRFRWFMKLCLVGVLVMSGNVSEAEATNYYVAASNGNDGNRGTIGEPFLTLERGLTVLIPGDTLYVRGGSYQRTYYMWEPPSGNSWEQPVTIMAYQNEKVIVRPLPGHNVFTFRDNSHYIIMDGFTIDPSGGNNGLQMGEGGHHIRIINSEIMNAPHNGIQGGNSNYLEFINLKVHDNNAYGFYLPGNHNLVKGCSIYRNGSWGVHIFSSISQPSNNTITNNRIYDNSRLGDSGSGVGVYGGTNNAVVNNVIWGNYMGVEVNYGAANSKIFNNTIHANSSYGIWLGSESRDSLVKNNIASLNGGNGIIITKGSGNSQIFNNLVAATNSSTGLQNWENQATLKGNVAGSINDLKFTNYQSHDFHLQAGSLAIGAGVVLTEVPNDYDYASRNQATAYDIGAFSFNGTPAPPPANSTPPPSADATPPTVTLTAPSAGTVSGTVTISASASDNVGVAGVQFRLQGANLGPEDTTNAYSISWNTTTVSNGSYSLTATARDAAGNTTTSPPRTVTVSNTSTSSPSSSLSISNLTVASGQAYVVPTGGLQAGNLVYRDRTYTFTTVPSIVQGARYIQTANNDKTATNSAFLSFTVNQPVSVYVAHGDRITPKPSWLSAFTDTGTNLVTSDATFSLFVRTFPAGTITLGGNVSSANAGNLLSMYSVIVKPQSGTGSTTPPPPPPPPSSPPTSSSLSISNLTVASGQAYVVPAGGLQAGNLVYRDRTYTFTTVPSIVQGARYIQTANNDKTATNSAFLSFTVNQPVSVYVAHGDRITPKPSWLSAFTDTGTNLVTSDATFSLFVRTFPAGTITLGGNVSSANAGNLLSMYSVIIKQ